MKTVKINRKAKLIIFAAVLAALALIIIIDNVFPNPLGPNVRLITGTVSAISIIAACLILALTVYRAVKNRRIKIVSTIFLVLALVILVGLNLVVSGLHVLLNQLFTPNKAVTPTEITERAKELTMQLEAEGLVLLKNDNRILPLSKGKVNVFGYASQQIVYGGAGSGSSDESKNVTLKPALEAAGFEVNQELVDFYKSHQTEKTASNVLEMLGGGYDVPEVPVSEYSAALLDRAKAFSDTAIIVISRNGGEGADMPLDMAEYTGGTPGRHYLQLTDNEADMVSMVESNFNRVIVLVNSSSPLNLGFLDNGTIDAALWIGGPGSTGLLAVAKVLSGDINPSGRLVDIYAYDVTSSPGFFNTGSFKYLGSEHPASGLTALFSGGEPRLHSFNNYQEGIYVGYRYYETAAEDGFIDYDVTVQYPFGYGLSYTTFEQTMGSLNASGDLITVDITVKNTGNAAGKDVVQLYNSAPYNMGGIEKAHVVLIAFAKTRLLQPNESQTLSLSFKIEDLGSYDYKTARAYVVEPGEYQIKLMNNSHDVIDSRLFTVDALIAGRRSDLIPATNRFDDAFGDVAYISRADWAGTMPAKKTEDKHITPGIFAQLQDTDINVDPNARDIVFRKNNLTLADLKGLPYDDPKWDLLLEQLSVRDMEYLIGVGGWQTVRVASVGKPQVLDIDGPAGLNGLINGTTGNQYTSAVVAASTWNTELVEEFGESLGREAQSKNVSGLYAPAMNIHRTPFSGRNFEYYSEDGFLSGKMGAAMVRGINSTNTYTYIKHFALDDQETNIIGLAIWSNEQAIREIYLRPFEITVKEGKSRAVMSSWNRIGTRWTGANKALLTDVLRGEWGFLGVVITDNAMLGNFMDPDQAIEAGNDLMLNSMSSTFQSSDSSYGRQNMRKASRNILYVVANSNALDNAAPGGVHLWLWVLIFVNLALFSLIALGFVKASAKKKPGKAKKNET
uniref:Beta-glucosidase n=1 Tax=uncultured bacterium contig00019 TaxID=1181510 RepID=A0A806K0N2_9BACT|nr:beta-glucosidase [uncultured bacterium contig00019]